MLNILKDKIMRPPRIVLYGEEGCGKTTFASQAPNPIFIQTEDGCGEVGVDRFPLPRKFNEVLGNLAALCSEEHEYKTVVLDTADWLEPLIIQSVCDDYNVDSILTAAGGYGKGYERARAKWGDVLAAFDYLRNNKNMTVIIIAHRKVKTYNDPENAAYDRYMLRLNDKTCDYLVEWADCVLYCQKKLLVTHDDKRNIAKPIGADGGERVMRTSASPACVAKNRYNLPSEMPLNWQVFEEAITKNNGVVKDGI